MEAGGPDTDSSGVACLPNSLGNLYSKTLKMLFVNNLTNYAFKNTQSVLLLLCFLAFVYCSTEH